MKKKKFNKNFDYLQYIKKKRFNKKFNKIYVVLFFKYVKSNIFFSIIYKKKVKFILSTGMLGYDGKKKRSYMAMEKMIIKICNVLEKSLQRLHKFKLKKKKFKNLKIEIFLFLDLYMNFFRIKKPLMLMF